MASDELLTQLRIIVGEEFFDDTTWRAVLDMFADSPVQMHRACSTIWQMRAGRYHTLVNVSESGSSRNLGEMHKNALAMADYYSKLAASEEKEEAEEEAVGRTRTRRIVRP